MFSIVMVVFRSNALAMAHAPDVPKLLPAKQPESHNAQQSL